MADAATGGAHAHRHADGVDVPTARRLAHDAGAARLLPPAPLPLDECGGTVLAAPLVARSDAPSVDSSAMDGFAVRGEGPWSVVDRVLAGAVARRALTPGEAAEVATGAPVPAGTERVLPIEDVTVDGSRVALTGPWPSRRHVRRRGEQVTAGTVLLDAGVPVSAAVLGLAASAGADSLTVRRRPRVGALLTGDELVTSGVPRPGQVRDAVGPLLPGLVEHLGGRPVEARRSGDDARALGAALDSLLATDADVVVTCGMAGAGPADHLHAWLGDIGASLVVDGVAVRPGHPQLLAVLPDGRPLVGLPGNPLAAVAALLLLLGPVLDGMTGRVGPPAARVRLVGAVPSGRPVTSLVPVRRGTEPGTVEAAGPAGPAQLWGLALADAVAVVPPGAGPQDLVELLPLP
ncbi:molybdopterin molybdotransferase MoeA [Aquipuribacter nitratireducens]|uniref:Molybdopterin molybdenumtransferase n=1 Tax=Aquipuribacter nitratireducens TaxID=650104 RepID=A0ABW0GQH3_9MICO